MYLLEKSFTEVKTASNENFGITFSLFFLIIFLYFYFAFTKIIFWVLVLSITCFIIVIIKPSTFTLPNLYWTKLGILLGKIISPIIMGCIFYLVVTPTGFLMRTFSKNILYNKRNNKTDSYWIKKNKKSISMINQF